jgi:hypothetical protein
MVRGGCSTYSKEIQFDSLGRSVRINRVFFLKMSLEAIYFIPSGNCNTEYSVPSEKFFQKLPNPLRNLSEGCQYPSTPATKYITRWPTIPKHIQYSCLILLLKGSLFSLSLKNLKFNI